MEPSDLERASREAAQLLWHFYGVRKDATGCYGDLSVDLPAELCGKLRTESDLDTLLYSDARDAMKRRLATWWEMHEVEDDHRLAVEAELERLRVLREDLLQRLTEDELRALGVKE